MKKEIRIRCWIDLDGERFFGPGRAELLGLVAETGSISKAAKAMGMSYKKAWAMITEMNTMAKKPLVVSQKGGQHGGGAQLTDEGRKMVAAYAKLARQLHGVVAKNSDILKLI